MAGLPWAYVGGPAGGGLAPAHEQVRGSRRAGAGRSWASLVGWRRELRTAHSGPHDGRDLAEGDRVLGADQHAQLGDGARRGEVRPELEGAAEVAEVLLSLAVLAPPPLELVGAPDLPRRVRRSLPLTPAATGAPSPRGGGGVRCGVRGRGGDAAVCRRRTRARSRAGEGARALRRSCRCAARRAPR